MTITMIRQAPRHLLQRPQQSLFRSLRPLPRHARLISSTPPAQRPRSWKSLFVRAGLAVGVVYYYNTSNLFAEEPAYVVPLSQTASEEETSLPTLKSLITPRAAEAPVPSFDSQPYVRGDTTRSPISANPSAPLQSTSKPSLYDPAPLTSQGQQQIQEHLPTSSLEPHDPNEQDPQDLEDSAHSEGAFNEETGEINWDCPCLGGMANGTCGERFRAAFSCFVYSKDEPKGMDCIDKFKEMQGCFREHPEEYGAEIDEDEEDEMMEGEGLGEPVTDDGRGAGHIGMAREGYQGLESHATDDTIKGTQARYPSGEPLPEAAKKGVRDAENVTAASESMTKPSPSPSLSTAPISSSSTSSSSSSLSSPRTRTSDTSRTRPLVSGEGGRQQQGERGGRGEEEATLRAKAAKSQMQTQQQQHSSSTELISESDNIVPKAAHDARTRNSTPQQQ